MLLLYTGKCVRASLTKPEYLPKLLVLEELYCYIWNKISPSAKEFYRFVWEDIR